MTRDQIKSNYIRFNILSIEWITHFGLSVYLILFSLLLFYHYFKKYFLFNHQITYSDLSPILIFTLGIICYIIQHNKLKYKTLNLPPGLNREIIHAKLIKILLAQGWIIQNETQTYLIANFVKLFRNEVLVIYYKSDKLCYTAINNWDNRNSFASHFNSMKEAKTIINEIRSACA